MKDKVSKLTSSLGSGAKTALADAGKAAVVIGTDSKSDRHNFPQAVHSFDSRFFSFSRMSTSVSTLLRNAILTSVLNDQQSTTFSTKSGPLVSWNLLLAKYQEKAAN